MSRAKKTRRRSTMAKTTRRRSMRARRRGGRGRSEEEEVILKLLKQLFTQNPCNAIISTMLTLLLDTVCLSSVLPEVHIATLKTRGICFANKQNNSASCVIIRRIRVYCLPRAPLFRLAEAVSWHCHHMPLLGSRSRVTFFSCDVGGRTANQFS